MIVQISDLHVLAGPTGEAAAAALREVVAAIEALPLRPPCVLVSGDLVHDGGREDYALVQELLAPLGDRVVAIPGNHDDAALVRELFGDPGEVAVGDLRLVLCDTTIPGADTGTLDVGALRARLASDDRPTVIAMHHPPLVTGIAAIDELTLRRECRDELAALLAESPQVKAVVCGHVHRVTFETLGGCGVFTGPATYEQIEPGATAGTLAFVERGRAFAIHTWAAGALVSQIQAVR